MSGFLNKQAFSIWSTTPPDDGPWPAVEDVSDDVADAATVLPVHEAFVGEGTIASWTVEHLRGEPHRAIVFVDVELDGAPARTMASTGDRLTCKTMLDGDWIGRTVVVNDDGSFLPVP